MWCAQALGSESVKTKSEIYADGWCSRMSIRKHQAHAAYVTDAAHAAYVNDACRCAGAGLRVRHNQLRDIC